MSILVGNVRRNQRLHRKLSFRAGGEGATVQQGLQDFSIGARTLGLANVASFAVRRGGVAGHGKAPLFLIAPVEVHDAGEFVEDDLPIAAAVDADYALSLVSPGFQVEPFPANSG